MTDGFHLLTKTKLLVMKSRFDFEFSLERKSSCADARAVQNSRKNMAKFNKDSDDLDDGLIKPDEKSTYRKQSAHSRDCEKKHPSQMLVNNGAVTAGAVLLKIYIRSLKTSVAQNIHSHIHASVHKHVDTFIHLYKNTSSTR